MNSKPARPHQSQHQQVTGYVNLFLATSTERILNYWIVKSVNSVTTASFLYETVRHCSNIHGQCTTDLVLMDFARVHKTRLMRSQVR